ncbi:F0F1 ATP synthase subunit A [Neisseriaceae bacterium PsAf]|nr:F0F1 ATP synthase subunit A [Neisseriaceae bacterium PsAf]
MSSSSMTSNEYISHHLISYSIPEGPQTSMFDFSFINLDTLFFAIILGILAFVILRYAAKRATSGVPGRFQAAIELLYEFVDGSCKEMIHNPTSRKLVAPLGLTLFVWIFFMNAMDLLPVDLLPWAWQHLLNDEHAALRAVPTADLNTTMALSLSVLALCFYYSVKIKGLKAWGHELLSVPFGTNILFAIPNILMNIIEYVSKTLSHGMRLWGNMYAGEIVFMVIALLGGAWTSSNIFSSSALFLLQIILGSAWAIFHILIITLQAYLFMVLAFVYIGQAHDSH